MTMLDVGQGQSILLQSDGKTFLVDCGGDDDEDAADVTAEELLTSNKAPSLPWGGPASRQVEAFSGEVFPPASPPPRFLAPVQHRHTCCQEVLPAI